MKSVILTAVLSLYVAGVNAIPISDADIVTAKGKQWAQPELFGTTTWDMVNAVCPNQICSGILITSFSGSLDMDGWIWASMAEVTGLLYSYGVPPPLDLGSGIQELDSAWAPAFFADGWRDTGQGGDRSLVEGLVADSECVIAPPFPPLACQVSILDHHYPFSEDSANVTAAIVPYFTIGAWFYRAPADVPLPSSFLLVGIGLLALFSPIRRHSTFKNLPPADNSVWDHA